MAALTVDIPSAVLTDLAVALRERTPNSAAMTARQVYAAWLRSQLKPILEAYRLRQVNPLVQAEITARVEKEAALATEAQARKNAEQSIRDAVETAIGEIS